MRLLPGGSDHAGGRSAERHAEADRPADHRCDVRQHLPLRHLPAHSGSDQASGGVGRMITVENLSRRSILRGIGIGSGLVLGFRVGFRIFRAGAAPEPGFAPNVYVSIDNSGLVTIVAHRSEMGTGIRTGLPMVLADELEADWSRVKIVQAQGDPKYGDQNTDGSRSTWQFYQPMRVAGATARQMLEAAAGQIWRVPTEQCRAEHHAIVHVSDGRRLSFGDLVAAAAALPVPSGSALRFKPPSAWR